MFCMTNGIFFVIENPTNSRMWLLPFMLELAGYAAVVEVVLDVCMHGGLRNKSQKLMTNCGDLLPMAVFCDGRHEHAPW